MAELGTLVFRLTPEGKLYLQDEIFIKDKSILDYYQLTNLKNAFNIQPTSNSTKTVSEYPMEIDSLTVTKELTAPSIKVNDKLVATADSVTTLSNKVFPNEPTLESPELRRIYISETAPTGEIKAGAIWIKVEPTGSGSVG